MPIVAYAADVTPPANKWRITALRVCRTAGGALDSTVEALGVYPVYSFFIPRPVWTVNGNLVDSAPVYHQGRLVAYRLTNASAYLKSGVKNTVKFALPDQNASRVFRYDQTAVPPGECFEFF